MSEKRCNICNKVAPLSDFYDAKPGVPSSRCKTCDNSRKRKPTQVKINRMRARHRAVADLIGFHVAEFETLLAIRLAEAAEESEGLAQAPQAAAHFKGEPVRLKSGARRSGQKAGDRIDVARCPHCVKHHDRGHVCASCGASPSGQNLPRDIAVTKERHMSVAGPRTAVDPAALAEFNRGTDRARGAR